MAQAAKATGKPNVFQRLVQYFRDVWTELHRVVWPTRPEVVNLSTVVITTLFIFIVVIGLFDYVVVQIINVLPTAGR